MSQYLPFLGVEVIGVRRGYRNREVAGTRGSKSDEGGAPVTIIGCTPDSDNRSIEHHFVTFHGQLMCSGNQIYGIVVDELFRDIGAKEVSGTPRGDAPSFDV